MVEVLPRSVKFLGNSVIIIIIIIIIINVSNIPGSHEVKELQEKAILGTAQIHRKVLT
jgi:hypothetical protein